MALRLPKFQAGRPILEELTAEKLNQLVDAIRQCEINSGVGYDVTRGPGGTSLSIKQTTAVMPVESAGARIIGPTSSGINPEDMTPVEPGQASYNFETKAPQVDYQISYVHGSTAPLTYAYNTSNNLGLISESDYRTGSEGSFRYSSGVLLAASDTFRNIGLLSQASGQQVYDITRNNVTSFYGDECAAITSGDFVRDFSSIITCGSSSTALGVSSNVNGTKYKTDVDGIFDCGGTTYGVDSNCTGRYAIYYYTATSAGTADGAFTVDDGSASTDSDKTGTPAGLYTFRRTFDLGSINPSGFSVKLRVRLKSSGYGASSFNSVAVNGAAQSYTYFETQSSTVQPLQIDGGWVAGVNTIEVTVQRQNTYSYPSVSFEFLPTTALIVSKTGEGADEIGGLSDLTEAQQDLIGLGTPVKALNGNDPYIWSYKGTGSKTSAGSYNELRPA